MMKKVFFAILLIACIIPVLAQSKKELKEQKGAEDYAKMKELVNSKTYIFQADWASTQNGKRINLMSNPNFLKIDQENAIADLPYFGVSQSPSIGMNSGGGIAFEGLINNYKVEYNDKKQKGIIKFNALNKTEHFDIILTVFKNGNASLNVMSNSRNGISYDGKVKEIKKEE